MLLTLETTLRTVFTIFAAFWAVALVTLFAAIGLLMKKRERIEAAHQHHH